MVCTVLGSEKFRLVNAIFKQNMYSGLFESLDPLDTPINLFETDPKRISRYNLMKLDDIMEIDVNQGGCLFIPSNYWY